MVVISATDLGYIDLAVNFYLSSIKRHKISNFLFICLHPEACRVLRQFSDRVETFYGGIVESADRPSNFFSREFNEKTHAKLKWVITALKMGYNVLLSDVDIHYFKNPLGTLYSHLRKCDIQIQWDRDELEMKYNSGFYFLKASHLTVELLRRAIWLAEHDNFTQSDQYYLNTAIRYSVSKFGLKLCELDKSTFPCGSVYFHEGQREFYDDSPCKDCVIAHNNWIISAASKRYRAREHLFWNVDIPSGYYSAKGRKYLTYDQQRTPSKNKQLRNLKRALCLAEKLNRLVVLPKFFCLEQKVRLCNLLSIVNQTNMDAFELVYGKFYREYSFLNNKLVPNEIRNKNNWKKIKIGSCRNLHSIQSDFNRYPVLQLSFEWDTCKCKFGKDSI
ncbi:unnamed protein product [Dimorphilus gyrociliatus]|uniref:Nucleotide-diphospho-sugar transferase domain-containing protein n=1 Tax=Dimorphilus gyrociliatus TaxID=2664684 RepID=A0A7I8W823_9ANNE|nr:unnamed protein product [Dimorphilus gyrociliatus]